MLINPDKKTIDFSALKKKAEKIHPSQPKEIKGLLDIFSEENFIDFQVQDSKSRTLKLHTYREHGKSLDCLDKPRALIIHGHGLCAHVHTHGLVAKRFSEMGITSLGFDYRGHGKSEGLKGYIRCHQDLVADMVAFTHLVDKVYSKDIPRFYLGISLGGLVGGLIGLQLKDYFKGMMLLAPALDIYPYAKRAASFLKYFCFCCLCPSLPVPVPRGPNISTKNPVSDEKWMSDPYVYHGGPRLATVASLIEGGKACMRNLEEFEIPFVVAIGGVDKLVNVESSFDFFEKAKSKDKTLLYCPEMWHAVFHEDDWWQISDFLEKWMEKLLNPKVDILIDL